MTAAMAFAPSLKPLAPLRKTYAHVRFPNALLRAWVRLRLSKTDIVTDSVVRALADRRRIELSSTCVARRAGLDSSDVRRSLRKLERHGLVAREGNRHDPNGCVLIPATAESLERDSSQVEVSIGVLFDVVQDWKTWSRVEILVHLAVCGSQEARRRGLSPPRVTTGWLSSQLGVPERSCRWALRRLEARGVLRVDGHEEARDSGEVHR
jgi:DNA-binding Lrp family transcriptional regulator